MNAMAPSSACVRWTIRDRAGDPAHFVTREEWIAAWWGCIDEIEGAALPAYLRRAELRKLHAENAGTFLRMAKQGRFAAACEASGLIDAAIARLERGG